MRKGQFFLIGSILLAGLILATVGLQSGVTATSSVDTATRHLFERKIAGFTTAVQTAVRDTPSSARIAMQLGTYMAFTQRVDSSHGIQSRSYFLVGLPVEGGINVTVGNYWDTTFSDITVTVDGASATITSLQPSNTTTVRFSTTADTFRVTADIANRTHSFTTSRKVFTLFRTRSTAGETVWADTVVN